MLCNSEIFSNFSFFYSFITLKSIITKFIFTFIYINRYINSINKFWTKFLKCIFRNIFITHKPSCHQFSSQFSTDPKRINQIRHWRNNRFLFHIGIFETTFWTLVIDTIQRFQADPFFLSRMTRETFRHVSTFYLFWIFMPTRQKKLSAEWTETSFSFSWCIVERNSTSWAFSCISLNIYRHNIILFKLKLKILDKFPCPKSSKIIFK